MTTFAVALDTADASLPAWVQRGLASVPLRYRLRPADTAAERVVAVSGLDHDWPRRLRSALGAGVRGIMLARPGPADAGDVRDLAALAASANAVVGVDVGFAAHRSWQQAVARVRQDAAAAALLDSFLTFDGGSAVGAFLAQRAVVRGIADGWDRFDLVHHAADQYVVVARAGGLPVMLTGLRTSAAGAGLRVDLVGPGTRWCIRIQGDELARPGEITRFDHLGAHSQPLVYESSHRAAWLALHAALTGGPALSYTLDDLAEDLAIAARLGLDPTQAPGAGPFS